MPKIELYNKSFDQYLKTCKPFRMAFADPPDNIGLSYEGFEDKFDADEYGIFLQNILYLSMQKCEVLWLSLNSRHAFLAGKTIYDMTRWATKWEAKSCIQTFTFGQHNHNDLGNNHRLLYRIMKAGTELYPDAIRVPSWRQLNGDKRADPRGRVPGDTQDTYACSRDCLPLPLLTPKDIERFLSKIDRKDSKECWEWSAGKRDGYGRFRVGGQLYTATRLMWRLTHGTDPRGSLLLHKCDNPACCNPDHLFLGTDSDNNRDKESKGRAKHPAGVDNGLSKLNEEDVMVIYQSTDRSADLAARYSVSDVCINQIREGRTWTHITGELALSDVFNFPRVTGNSKQRRAFSPTQLHEGLYERCIKLCCASGDTVVDLFAGSGTLGRVGPRCGVRSVMIEISKPTCEAIAADLKIRKIR